jgi:hypothetical protein
MVVQSRLLTCVFIIDYRLHAVKRSLWPRRGLWSVPCVLPHRSLLQPRTDLVNWARVICLPGSTRLSMREGDHGATSRDRRHRPVIEQTAIEI